MKLNDDTLMKIVKYIGDNILQKAHDDKSYCILDSHMDLMDYLQNFEFTSKSFDTNIVIGGNTTLGSRSK